MFLCFAVGYVSAVSAGPAIPSSFHAKVSFKQLNGTQVIIAGEIQEYVLANGLLIDKILMVNETSMEKDLTIPNNKWNQSTSATWDKSKCRYDCKNGTSCDGPVGNSKLSLRKLNFFQPPPPPPQPSSACGVAVSFIADPFFLLGTPFAKNIGGCTLHSSSEKGQLWQVNSGDVPPSITQPPPPPQPTPATQNITIMYCIDTTKAEAVPQNVTVFFDDKIDGRNGPLLSVELDYIEFHGGAPPSSIFEIPATCKC
jgi:hypothetical protein